ncbi:hypothetical protein [Halobacterium sp. CBA1126]|uniref:hypothetical protein n=1 Tax=Halobacterium sp. CBA1126 TaxID=2668074 RepID=UPI0012FAD488|nr:hypothetical protein [Halobacterium sp. CBA1126]MUV59800.1 hypothetical protein [Halobacterium sp. CBA1126]
MTVDTFSCGHCPRDDFDSFDDLREHVEECSDDDGGEPSREAPPLLADGGPQTRECPDCGLITERTNLVLTEDGHHVCPDCGSIIQTYSALREPGPHVLVIATQRKSSATAHLPSEDNPLVPRCADKNRMSDANYKPVLNSRLAPKFSLCKHCDPNYKIENENTGEQLSAKLRSLEIDEEDDLIADGGTSQVDVDAHHAAINDRLDDAIEALEEHDDREEARYQMRQAGQHAEALNYHYEGDYE